MIAFLLAFVIATVSPGLPAVAQTAGPPLTEVQAGDLTLSGAFIRATLPRAPVAGGYVTIDNHGGGDDRLLSVTAPVGTEVQIHEMAHKDGVMTMRALPDGLPVPAGGTAALVPGGTHLMIMGLTERLEQGQGYDLTLRFEQAGEVTLRFDVLALNARHHPGRTGANGPGTGH
ncbi:MAG: copper chaperone PCu(A)C [Qingshengfaniella sp.]